MKLAFLYAGQGSQAPGMGRDFYEAYPEIRDIFDLTPQGLDLKQLCFEADMDTLSKTQHTQPCMGAFAAAVTRLLANQGIRPDCAAGLSLGEYGALHAAGVLDASALVDLLAFRGRAMADAAMGIDCAMTAIMGLEEGLVNKAIQAVGGSVWCCNFNCPGQIVIGGITPDVSAAAEKCKELGARRCIPLSVSGPFHTPMMEPAAAKLAQRLADQPMNAPRIPVVFNATGEPVGEDTIPGLLVRQIMSPVRFEDCLRRLLADGVGAFVEIGPGKVLSGFVRKVDPQAKVWAIEDIPSLERAITEIREALV